MLRSRFIGVWVQGCSNLLTRAAYAVELVSHGIGVARQVVYPLNYKGEYIGAYVADMVVENKIIVELKSVAKLNVVMEAQLLNYLRLSGLPVGYLINFCNTRLEWRRFVNTREAAS
jgi:GxxExxY protein